MYNSHNIVIICWKVLTRLLWQAGELLMAAILVQHFGTILILLILRPLERKYSSCVWHRSYEATTRWWSGRSSRPAQHSAAQTPEDGGRGIQQYIIINSMLYHIIPGRWDGQPHYIPVAHMVPVVPREVPGISCHVVIRALDVVCEFMYYTSINHFSVSRRSKRIHFNGNADFCQLAEFVWLRIAVGMV